VDSCGLNRKTFYYHFKDKSDLVNWIYYTEVSESIADCKNYENWTEGMYRTLLYLMKNKSFYINALNTPGQNDFSECFFDFRFEIIMNAIDYLSIEMNVLDKDKRFIADFYSHAFVGITTQWIKHGMKELPEMLVDGIRNILEGSMPHALNRYAK